MPKSARSEHLQTEVCIVGCGPVGMVLATILSKFNTHCMILEKNAQLSDHPKAHYLSFRTCEILADLDPSLKAKLESQLDKVDHWKSFNYTRHALAEPFASVQHLTSSDIYKFQEYFTYAYPSHFPQNRLNAALHEVVLK